MRDGAAADSEITDEKNGTELEKHDTQLDAG